LAQRQKAAIACAVLKRPDLIILNEATSALDDRAQTKVMRGLRDEFAGRCLVWVLYRANLARNFDRVLVMSNGKLLEHESSAALGREDEDWPITRRSEAI
jgi:ABC-type multidrug transport system fused ATPase/permease subunit